MAKYQFNQMTNKIGAMHEVKKGGIRKSPFVY